MWNNKKKLTAWKLLLDSVDMIVHEIDTLSESNMLQVRYLAWPSRIPVPDAIAAIERKLNSDPLLDECTPVSHKRITELLSFCLNATYFSYKGTIYRQKHGAAMLSPVSPTIANLYMKEFEAEAIRTAPNPPSVWLRYVDDTFVKIHEYFVNEFTEHLNSIDQNIKFTNEPETEGKLQFLDSCTTLNDDGSLDLTVYRSPHIQTNIWTLTPTIISNTRGLLY